MKMSKPGLCCDDCFTLIAKRSAHAARLWLDLCEIQENCSLFGLKIEDNPMVQLLEHLRFITTTDTPEVMVLKVHGKRTDSLGNFFCGGLCARQS